MSVLVRRASDGPDDPLTLYTKGAYERVKEYTNASSLPPTAGYVANALADEGCYVLALSTRKLAAGELGPSTSAADVEVGLLFVGFLAFRNELKPEAHKALAELKNGGVRTVMVTGDNERTGVQVARMSGLADISREFLYGTLEENRDQKDRLKLVWRERNGTPRELGLTDIEEVTVEWKDKKSAEVDMRLKQSKLDKKALQEWELAITGPVFKHLMRVDDQKEKKNSRCGEEPGMKRLLYHTRVFARMDPNDKLDCVRLHMVDYKSMHVGDGGNDVGAIRWVPFLLLFASRRFIFFVRGAHVGMALGRNKEASMVSPFSDPEGSVMSVVFLLREARATLATAFAGSSCFSYIQFV